MFVQERPMSFEQFVAWYPDDGKRYELSQLLRAKTNDKEHQGLETACNERFDVTRLPKDL